MKEPKEINSQEKIFEFPLEVLNERIPLYKDAVTEFFRQQLLNLLDVIIPTVKGEPVKIDGFAFLQNTNEVFPLWPEQDKSSLTIE